jgi:hypothetical protein
MSVTALRCDNCGALADASSGQRCRYCGATRIALEDVIAARFGNQLGTWEASPDVDGVTFERYGVERGVRVHLPARSELPPDIGNPTLPCAWPFGRSDFIDLELSATITFETDAAGAYAGFWLRRCDRGRIWVNLRATGQVDALLERRADGQVSYETLACGTPANASAGRANVLRARLSGDTLALYVNGVPSASMLCPREFHGCFELFARPADTQFSTILFEDPCAKLPPSRL